MKGDPIAPEKVLIPRVENLSAVLADDTVVLSWSPTMNYSTNKPLELSAAEVYRFDQDVTETLENLRIREEEQEEARKAAGLDTSSSAKKAAGELAGKINLLKMSPVQGFQSDSTLVARIPCGTAS